jgi:hypothetical protein
MTPNKKNTLSQPTQIYCSTLLKILPLKEINIIVGLVAFQIRDRGVQIFDLRFLYTKMKDLLVTKDPKRNCSIVHTFFRCFKVNCYKKKYLC